MQGSRRMVAANIAGGTHHAFAGHGEGFCKKYLVAFLLLSLKLLPNFLIHVDVTTEVYMLHQLIENVRGKQNSSSWICKHQLENCKHLGSLTWVQVCSMTSLLLQRCHCGIILTFAILNHQSSSLTLMSIRLVKQLSIHFTIHHINWPVILHTKRSEKFIQLFSPCFSNCFFKKKVECLVSLLCFEWILLCLVIW